MLIDLTVDNQFDFNKGAVEERQSNILKFSNFGIDLNSLKHVEVLRSSDDIYWDFVDKPSDLYRDPEELDSHIYEQLNFKQKADQYYNNKYCECCGKGLNFYERFVNYQLCLNCNHDYNNFEIIREE